MGVTTCLWKDPLPEMVYEVPQDPLRVAAVLAPTRATMSNGAMGVTYKDTLTTSVGWVAISGPKQEASTQRPIIEDITDIVE